jgi:hypothetical protein
MAIKEKNLMVSKSFYFLMIADLVMEFEFRVTNLVMLFDSGNNIGFRCLRVVVAFFVQYVAMSTKLQ